MNYVIGVDGGGSKTNIAIYNILGKKIDLIEWGPTNHEGLMCGYYSLEEEFIKIFKLINDKYSVNINNICMGVFGLSGLDTIAQYNKIYEILTRLGLKKINLINDAYLGIMAGSKKGYGVCSVNGTGCTVAGIDEMGNRIQIGGQGELTEDFGGGYILGNAVISKIYNFLYKNGQYTIMKDMVFNELSITKKECFIDIVRYKNDSGEFYVKDLNKFIFKAAEQKDEVAINLINKMAESISNSIVGALKELHFTNSNEIDIILSGAIHIKEKDNTTFEMIEDKLGVFFPSNTFNIYKLNTLPVYGAINWAFKEINKL